MLTVTCTVRPSLPLPISYDCEHKLKGEAWECWRSIGNIKVSLNVFFNRCYQFVSLQILFVGLHPICHLRIIGTECLDDSYKRRIMEEIPQAVVGDGFKDFCQTGWGSRDAFSGRKLIGDKQPKIFGADSILEQLVAHFSLECCKLGGDGLTILVCKNDSFTQFMSSSSCRQEWGTILTAVAMTTLGHYEYLKLAIGRYEYCFTNKNLHHIWSKIVAKSVSLA